MILEIDLIVYKKTDNHDKRINLFGNLKNYAEIYLDF